MTAQPPYLKKYNFFIVPIVLFSLFSFITGSFGQTENSITLSVPSALGIENGTIEFNTPFFRLELVKSSQTISRLEPIGVDSFDFTPHERLAQRSNNNYYHLGDLNFRIRTSNNNSWDDFSTAAKRAPVEAIEVSEKNVLAAADLTNTLPVSLPLKVYRYWEISDGQLVLRFEFKNRATQTIELGSIGIPMIFNNILDGKTLEQAHAQNVFYDPYVGMDAGYIQVTRLHGHGPVLLVLPYKHTPFEAYNPLLNEATRRGISFEGFYEWMILSKAYAENEWKNAQPWNIPSSVFLKPNEVYQCGVRFILTDSVENIEKTLIKHNLPVAVGIPGYVIPKDVNASLFLKYHGKIQSVTVEPKNALTIKQVETTKGEWVKYLVDAKEWGRARVTITYADSSQQTIHYKIVKSESELIADYGRFSTHQQWFSDKKDTFHRAPSVMTYDNEKKEIVKEDSRAWIAGLGDEGGSGSWLGAIMKQLVQPNKEEIVKLDSFVNLTLWGQLQYSTGPHKYGVRKSLFYYQPDIMPAGTYSSQINYSTWSAWNREHAESVGRSYNYPHVAAAYWVMYRLARNYQNMGTSKSWNWYLEQAFYTIKAMVEQAPDYVEFGQMEGSVFLLILSDLMREHYIEFANELEQLMKIRMNKWLSLAYPFGSEMAWDSTGQEEVYMRSKYFGFDDKAAITLKAILAYMPTVPHWAYNGNARRYWDFLYGGKLSRIERQIHHYGSGLNAIPVLFEYRQHPENFYLLKVGYGGLMGTISNITQEGFAPCAFHSFPSTLKNDGISGDYGPGFYGYAVNSATYILNHEEFGWLAFGGNIVKKGNKVIVSVTTASNSRIYIAPYGLWLKLDVGNFESVLLDPVSHEVEITLTKANEFMSYGLLTVEYPAHGKKYSVKPTFNMERNAYKIPLKNKPIKIRLVPEK